MLHKTNTDPKLDLNHFCNQFVMSNNANTLLDTHTDLDLFLNELITQKYFSDAILLIVYRLNPVQAIHWACSIASLVKTNLNNQDQLTLNAITIWLKTPSEANLQNTLNKNTINIPRAVNWLAMAAYWSSSQLSKRDENIPNNLIQDAVYSSIMLSILLASKNEQELIYKNAINGGIILLS